MIAGTTEACTLQPLDVAKTRLQLDHSGKYKGLINCVQTIIKEEGVASLYKGLTPFVTHLTIKYALRFGSFNFFKRQLGVVQGSPNEAIGNFTAGLLSGLTEAVLIVTPFETVKIRLRELRRPPRVRSCEPSRRRFMDPVPLVPQPIHLLPVHVSARIPQKNRQAQRICA